MDMVNAQDVRWKLPSSANLPADPLADCLVILTRYYQHPFSLQTLVSGLPLVDGKLTPELFIRAAQRAEMTARVMSRRLDEISPNTLPVVLLLNANGGQSTPTACVALRCSDDGQTWTLLQPESGGGEMTMSAEALARVYAGGVIYVKPGFKYADDAEHSAVPRPKHWLLGVLEHAWPLYSEVLLASFLINVFALLTPLFIMNVYDRVVPNEAYETLWTLAIGLGIAYCFDFLMRGLRGYFLDVAGKQIDVILLSSIFEQILGLRSAVRPRSVGGLANNLQEFESFREMMTAASISTLIDLPFALLFLGIIWWVGGWIIVVPLIAIPLTIAIGILLQPTLSALVSKVMRATTQKQSLLIETLGGVDTLKAFGAEGGVQRKWEQTVGEIGQQGLSAKLMSAVITNQSLFLQNMAVISVVIVGVYQIAAHNVSVGGLIACSLLVTRAMAPFSQIAALMTRFYQVKAALKGIDSLMQLPVERPAGKSFVHRPGFEGNIEFRDVSFSYPGQEVGALHGVSFRIRAGERVGIIGRVGSGKTTIEKLILGLYQPDSGSIWIDGLDLQQIDPADVRHHVGYVPQDIVLFAGSVRDNLMLGSAFVDDQAMLRAAEIGGVMDFVGQHPKGLHMQIGERGESLSGGQRQAIAIARALVKDPPMLLLDEPTNALDNRSEENLKAKLAKHLTPRHTLILVTHRASLLSLVDRLIVMDGGRIVADGDKKQVLEALSGGKIHV
jgi:ATP-binding cassette, subfamily C, bacterial LapB